MTAAEEAIDVLLATYNGAPYLAGQLDSVFAQAHRLLRLLVRDDGSSDGTQSILADYAARPQCAVVTVDPQGPHLGPCGSFARLLEQSIAAHVMLCDQDDVWLPEKTGVLLGRMRELERQLGSQTPILVHSDLVVVDDKLQTLHGSFWRCRRLDPRRGSALNRLLVENVVAGCGAMLNRALVLKCLPIPDEAVMHDWWMALVAAALGRLECVPQATVLYRQHSANRIGVKRPGAAWAAGRARAFFRRDGFRGHLLRTQRQARALLERFGPDLRAEDREIVEAYASLESRGFFARRLLLLRHGFRSASWIGNAKLWAGI